MHRNQSVNVHQFAMVPKADIPRSAFRMQKTYKTTFNAASIVPIFCEEVLPGDTFNVRMTAFARLATPIFPFMDNMYFDSFFFFVPNRLVWDNWQRFMGEQPEPDSSTSFVIPQVVSPVGGWPVGSVADYFGLPTVGQVDPTKTVSCSALPGRAYGLIYNEWFRDENLVFPVIVSKTDGPDDNSVMQDNPVIRGKRHDYFTSALPWTQKGGPVPLIIAGNAPVYTNSTPLISGAHPAMTVKDTSGNISGAGLLSGIGTTGGSPWGVYAGPAGTGSFFGMYPSNLYADLSQAAGATVNALRQSFQVQKLLERDARGGTRYTEIIRAHFGVVSPDARLQRPEYLGGGSTPISINPVAQTAATGGTGTTTPQGNLAAVGTLLARGHGFTQSFTEHGYVLGMINVRADLTYQNGMRRMWSRSTRYDFYFPAFAMLGEQAILQKEIFCDGTADDNVVFGYQERWAEYRYNPSQITGVFRSTTVDTLDAWHLAQNFDTAPVLGATFIQENPPVDRVIAVEDAPQFLLDAFFDMNVARPMPMYSVPGLIDHF